MEALKPTLKWQKTYENLLLYVPWQMLSEKTLMHPKYLAIELLDLTDLLEAIQAKEVSKQRDYC